MAKTYKQKFNEKHNQPLDKTNSIKKIAELSGIKYRNALKIVEKGRGAYYSNPKSVRPNVKSATQWGIARLHSAVGGGASANIDKDLLK